MSPSSRKPAASKRRAGSREEVFESEGFEPGRFIVLEGVDGAGTTTQCERLAAALREEGRIVRVTRQPSDGPVGMLIRQALTGRLGMPGGEGPLGEQTLALLFAADRVDHLEAQVLPALNQGEIVICDRYVLSSLAYQGTALPLGWVEDINAFAVKPHLTLFLEVDAETALQRRARRGGDAELFEQEERQKAIIAQYDQIVSAHAKQERIARIDGTKPLDEVTRLALAEIHAELKRPANVPGGP